MKIRRRGTVLPLMVVCLVGMCGFVGLAIDLGLVAVAKTQCQNAADAAAMAGARSLDGTPGQNLGSTTTVGSAMSNCQAIAMANIVLNQNIQASNVVMLFGTFHYDTTNQVFTPTFPDSNGTLPTGDNYNLVQVTINTTVQTTFASAFAAINPSFQSMMGVSAVSQAAHRPRDVCIILDYSGSMNNESDLWNNEAYLDNGQNNTTLGYIWPQPANTNFTSNNLETVYPLFGPYSQNNNYGDYTSWPNLLCPAASSGPSNYFNTPSKVGNNTVPATASMIGKSNVSIPALGVVAQVGDYYANPRGAGTLTAAFTSQPDTYATTPVGDTYLSNQGGSSKTWSSPAGSTYTTTVATTVNDIRGTTTLDSTWESQGYKAVTGSPFKGHTVGPRYWGKTFFMWPPDPTNDWRRNFFFEADGVTPLDDNNMMFKNAYPGYLDPPGNYVINYKAILNWIRNTGTNPFPNQMRSGDIQFYSSIPSDVPASAYNHNNPNYNITNTDQRFWKEYIDWVLGVWRSPEGNVQHTQNPTCSIGPDFVFGTVQITGKPTDGRYMDYKDNVWRPRHRMWFGPMTMIQFMLDTGIVPGTAHDISMYPMKSGVGAALQDIQNNHPNDKVALLPFSRPQFTNDNPSNGSWNNPQYNLNNNYTAMLNSMWLPNVTSSDQAPWDTATVQIPHAHGDWNANTSSSYGFMLAYNQYSSSTTVSAAGVGGLGRKGSTRLIIYETDGMANEDSVPTGGTNGFVNNGKYNSYYAILPGQTVNGAGYSQTNLLQVVEAICNKDDSTAFRSLPSGYPTPPAYPGYATPSKPVIVHCIAFGAIFEAPNSIQTSSVSLLQQISTIGGTVFPANSTPTAAELAADSTTPYKWCIGTLDQRRQRLEQAITRIFDSSVPVSMVQ
jgi:Flp pilus assembly protein TadG